MAIGKKAGIRDVVAVRLFQAFLVAMLSLVIFTVGRLYLGDWGVGALAALVPLISSRFAEWMVAGTQPKLSMIVFGMLSLLLLAKQQFFLAGLSSMLSCLAWQPGLMFTGVVVVIASNYFTTWRDMHAVSAIMGAALPAVAFLGYFYWAGALSDLWAWTITFNYSVFRPETQREPLQALLHIMRVALRVFAGYAAIGLLGIAGVVSFIWSRVKSAFKQRELTDRTGDALVIPVLIYFGFCIINMQAGPDLIPFIPFISIFAAWFVMQAGEFVSTRLRSRKHSDQVSITGRVFGFTLTILLLLSLGRGVRYRVPDG